MEFKLIMDVDSTEEIQMIFRDISDEIYLGDVTDFNRTISIMKEHGIKLIGT